MKKFVALLVILSMISLIGCGVKSEQSSLDKESYRSVNLTDKELKGMFTEALELLENQQGKDLKYVDSSFSGIKEEDIIDGLGSTDIRSYTTHGALYIQVYDIMYRFQINNDKKITSYIKYIVEG